MSFSFWSKSLKKSFQWDNHGNQTNNKVGDNNKMKLFCDTADKKID